MTLKFEDKISLVTGGSRGVGRAICLDLARNGSDVALIYHSRTDLADEVVKEIEAAPTDGNDRPVSPIQVTRITIAE